MARYRHIESGVTVSVADDREMDSSWEPADESKPAAKKTTAKRASSSSNK